MPERPGQPARGNGDNDEAAPERRVGIALSGGGHRATAFGVGVLAAVVETRLHHQTVSIGSVSGGSITNSAVATAGDFRELHDVAELADWVAPTLRVVATDGLFLPGKPTSRYVANALAALVFAACSLLTLVVVLAAGGRGHDWWVYMVAGGLAGLLGGWITAKLITHRVLVDLPVGIALGAGIAGGMAQLVHDLGDRQVIVAVASALVVAVGCVSLALWALSRRGEAVVRGLARQFARPGSPDPQMREITSSVNHVYCTTDLESAQNFFFAPKFAYGYRHGLADMRHSPLTVAAVTQASAAVPPGFPPVTIEVTRFRNPDDDAAPDLGDRREVKVSDGGVYDNLGDEWEVGLERRAHSYPELASIQDAANVLVVADATPRFGLQPFSTSGLVAREVRALLRNLNILRATTTTRRRHDLYEQFRSQDSDQRRHSGVLVMIDNSPVDVCTAGSHSDDHQLRERAERALRFLEMQHTAGEWALLSKQCSNVPTTLGPLTPGVTLNLIELAFTSTLVELYVFLELGELRAFPREVFERQVA